MKSTVLSSFCAMSVFLAGCTTNSRLISTDIGGNTRIFVPMKSLKAIRDENVVKQGFDYSCGAGALATLLSYGVGDKVTEAEILNQLMLSLPKDEKELRKKQGFSLADLQKVALMRGHKSLGFRIAPEYLGKLAGPVIVFIKPRGYEHFAVLKGVRGDRVYLADPSLGNVRMQAYKFLDMWLNENGKGIIFVVENRDGRWPADYPLKLKGSGPVQPEVLSIRELLEVGHPLVRFPEIR
jgi:predicted double-glycine peptidase